MPGNLDRSEGGIQATWSATGRANPICAGGSPHRDAPDRTSPQNNCAWVFDEGDGQPSNYTGACGEEVRTASLRKRPW